MFIDKKNAVVGVAVNFNLSNIRNFVLSFREVNKIDECILLIDTEHIDEMTEFLKDNNVTALRYEFHQFANMRPHNSRYIAYLELLSNRVDLKNIFLADTKDIIFQMNPFENLPEEFIYFFEEDAGIKLVDDQSCNSYWLDVGYGREITQTIWHNNIICSGTILGSHGEIIKFLNIMKQQMLEIRQRNPNGFRDVILDQAIVNYLVRTDASSSLKKEIKRNGDIVATLGISMCETRALDKVTMKQYELMVNHFYPAILHQYDRYPMFLQMFNTKFK